MTMPITWQQTNQQLLLVALEGVRTALLQHSGAEATAVIAETPVCDPPAALDTLCALFHLSSFERAVLLLCAGIELDGLIAELCAQIQGLPNAAPTFSLALALFPDAHWDALRPSAPLRRWRLIEIGPGAALTTSPLRINETVLHYLAGAPGLDERLQRLLNHVAPTATLSPSRVVLAEQLADSWRNTSERLPVVQLFGTGVADATAIAAAACAGLGLHLQSVQAMHLPTNPAEIDSLAVVWERDALLNACALLIECGEAAEDGDITRAVQRLVEQVHAPVLVAARERHQFNRAGFALEIERPNAEEQRQLWRASLGPLGVQLNGQLDQIVDQFSLDSSAIKIAAREALRQTYAAPAQLQQALWRICRQQARNRLDDLAQRINPSAGWDDLVLPEMQMQVLRDIAAHVRQRAVVYEKWGFGHGNARGLGISALFAGPSGTGKTTAAEVLADALDLDLYRIDLSGVVSKYIGETEKNLRRVFDAAEQSGAVLLFDEADAIFGKRSEVKDSHDRYANIEVGYLLQRMETYRGLAVLTTNLKQSIDQAFLRRIRFVINFPFPDITQRIELWHKIFPPNMPREALDYGKLARLNIAGGNIRIIALNAAFMAADECVPVQMRHLLRAARVEYAKLEKPLTESEIAGWVS